MIEKLHEDTFSFLSNVKSISVANNYIQKIERHTFRNLYEVKVINISYNWLKELDLGVFYRVPSLEVLDLSHNWLETLPWENISQQLLSLKVLGLKDNPWNCSCQMKDILKLNHSLLNETQAICQHPHQLNGTLLKDLKSDAFSNCFTTKQHLEIKYRYIGLTYIITSFCIILSSLCMCSYRLRSKQFATHVEKASKTPSDYKRIGQIGYNIKDALSRYVYRGELSDGQKAAIKKHDKMVEACKELRLLLHLSEKARPHPNIIRYLCMEHDHDADVMYLALELCDGDLMTAVMEKNSEFHDIADPQNYFLQLTSGICFLHKQGIQHRDIKPQNILWKRTVDGTIALVISDFDMGHFCKEKSSHQTYGTIGWSAPELYLLKPETRSNAVDIFSLGCVFYFILTRGHPFGEISAPGKCQQNIISPEYQVSLDALYENFNHNAHLTAMAKDLIERMICLNASDRIEDYKIMKHPFLLKEKQMKDFLTKIGEYMDDKVDPKVTNFKDMLGENSNIVFDGKWLDKVDKCARTDLSRYRKTGNDDICCLLRTVRNKMIHFCTLGKAVRDTYLGSEFGVIEYYTKLFPKLVIYTYDVLERSEIENFTF